MSLCKWSNCLACRIPSKEKLDSDSRCSSFSHPRTEKSDSTEEVFGKTVYKAPANDRRAGKRPFTTALILFKRGVVELVQGNLQCRFGLV